MKATPPKHPTMLESPAFTPLKSFQPKWPQLQKNPRLIRSASIQPQQPIVRATPLLSIQNLRRVSLIASRTLLRTFPLISQWHHQLLQKVQLPHVPFTWRIARLQYYLNFLMKQRLQTGVRDHLCKMKRLIFALISRKVEIIVALVVML